MKTDKEILDDLIAKRGGLSNLAKELGYVPQRVWNWTIRGIPADVKLAHPHLFIYPFAPKNQKKTVLHDISN